MRTFKGWLGLARRWTPTGHQRDVEQPTTVIVVGTDECDDSLLWFGEGQDVLGGVIGFRPFVDVFVVGLDMGSGGGLASPAVYPLGIEPNDGSPQASSQLFIRSPPGATPNAEFVRRAAPAASGPAILGLSVTSGSLSDDLPATGILVRLGETMWLSANPPVGVPILRVAWRG